MTDSKSVHDETTLDASATSAPGPRAFLALVAGDTRQLIPIPPDVEISIGRSRSCHVVLPDRRASRLQATLRWEGGQLWLTDRGSRNGTFVGGKRIHGRVAVRPGELIGVGAARMAVVLETRGGDSAPSIVAASAAMKDLVRQIERVAEADSSVLLIGETGTGKELLARHLHASSGRAAGPFVAINCGAIPEALAESTLFGHEKGAFSGATKRTIGVFEASSGGTLFLDEVGELSERTQARMLRVLETGELMRVGGTRTVTIDVRVVSATHRDIESDPRFRRDLFFRLAALRFAVPPLRERPEDIEALARHLVQELSGGRRRLKDSALRALREQPWPGNVRELRNVLEASMALSDAKTIGPADLALRPATADRLDSHLDAVVRDRILAALAACNGNQSAAARRLGISRRALIYRMEKVGLKAKPASAKD